MAKQTVVRYTTKDEAAAKENQRLIEAVFADLAAQQPAALSSYDVAVLDDGRSFVHVAVVDGDANPLLELESFRTFSSTVGERADAPPVAVTGEVFAAHP
ncbi:MAG TPA: hypothetical protein VHE83_10305 [Mycobacteriales bacterium]|nr:hypothetical protein [Mycobacteriales bacterium]